MNVGTDNCAGLSAATLASLPQMTPTRLRRIAAHFGGVEGALEAVRDGNAGDAFLNGTGEPAPFTAAWPHAVDTEAIERLLRGRATHVWIEGDVSFPFTKPVPTQPFVLFGEGDVGDAFDRPRVAIVGTRSATPHGLADAAELGAFLARAGVTVISGLAIGIDAAAHDGALRAGGAAIGVVATGLDVEYPRRHTNLYRRVRARGAVVGECWYGVPPERWRFPVRNRIIAALADAVIVVEATHSGGARITANEAAEYGRPVLAVPGSRRNGAAAGCNALIADGAQPLLQPSDVLVAIDLAAGGRVRWMPPAPPANPDERSVLRALAGEPGTLDDVIVRSGLTAADAVRAVRALEQRAALRRQRGFLWPC
jgi:DNA processing protein